jgi:MFS family permease
MDTSTRREIRLINAAGVLGTLYGLALGELLLFFVTQCLGIPKEDWALVAALLPLTTALHLVSAYLTEHFRRRKVLSLTCFAVARLAIPAITLLPFISGQAELRFRLYYLAAALIAHGSINALGVSAWLSWVADIVPEEHRGRFWAARMALTTLIYCGVYLAASWLVGHLGQENPWGYVWVFSFAFLVGEIDLVIHSRVPDRPMPVRTEPLRLLPLLAEPWRHKGFRALMIYRTVLVFGGFVTTPFAGMYMIEELGFSPWEMGLLSVIWLVVTGVSVFLWRRIGDRVGYRNVCLVADSLCSVVVLYWWFIPYGNLRAAFLLYAGARVCFGLLNAGNVLGHTTLTMNIAPEKHRSTYFDQVTIIVALAMSAGIFFGRWLFITLDPVSGTMFFGTKLTTVHTLLGIYALTQLLGPRLFLKHVPDTRADLARPRIRRLMRTNPMRLFPTLIPLERPISSEQRTRHLDSMRSLVPEPKQDSLTEPLKLVLRDTLLEEDEFYAIVGHVRRSRARSIERMTDEIRSLASLHHNIAIGKEAADEIKRLYARGKFLKCLEAVQRLARRTAEPLESERVQSALAVIDGLVDNVHEAGNPREEAVLLGVYAYLQIVREPEPGARD